MAGRKGEKHWRDALMVAVNRIRDGDPDQRPLLAHLAEKCLELALQGDMQAIKEIGNRLDGRAPQAIEVTDDFSAMSNEELGAEIAQIETKLYGRPHPGRLPAR